ncbi:deoxynucleoside monophosphate kinase [Pseudomonas phage Alpheus]|uniref:Deoxynucleoside monophosphate kinase n=1 Tax=Pseudomonas phage Alpheus TaxID=2163983 RepID=A0A2S1GMZ4_9CAUD|nr:deoxynucleoside monophosphate kinase [Pseudomonas phage Alpheus]AWD90746.1 deoxynucleoside monophosphate kinase [Pseudomonas phage Alpheus]
MFVLGMSGAKRSGKDFAASIILEEMKRRGYRIHRTSFAKALREMTCFITGCEPKAIDRNKDVGNQTFVIHLSLLSIWLRQRGIEVDTTDKWELAINRELYDQQQVNRSLTFNTQSEGFIELTGSGRDLLIVLGQAARQIDPDFWVKRCGEELNEVAGANLNLLAVITDVRPQNEARACDFVLEIQNPGTKFEGTATESRLPEHLRHLTLHNFMDASFGNDLRRWIPSLCKLVDGKNGDTPAMLDRRQWLNPELYNRAFLEVR